MSVRPTPADRQWLEPGTTVGWSIVRLVIATCSVDYDGRLTAHLPLATRLLLVKADGSVLVHSDGGSYKPLNWMSPPCKVRELGQQGTHFCHCAASQPAQVLE